MVYMEKKEEMMDEDEYIYTSCIEDYVVYSVNMDLLRRSTEILAARIEAVQRMREKTSTSSTMDDRGG
jgi:hypothetical protein